MKDKLPNGVSQGQRWAATAFRRVTEACKSHAALLLTGALLLSLSLHFVNPARPHCSVLPPRIVKTLTGQLETKEQAAARTALKNGRFAQESNACKSRMVHFKGYDLLVTVPANDEFVGSAILGSGQPFQGELVGPLMDLITPGSTVVDVGGNLGSFTVFFAAATGLDGKVYSFEPQNKMFQLICTNAVNNGLMNVYPKNVALSFKADTIHMSSTVPDGAAHGTDIREAEKNGSTINYGGMNLGKGGEEVQSKTLDSYNLTSVSLIKMDAQGAEQLVVYGGRETIRTNLPVVVYEVAQGWGLTTDMIESMRIPTEVQNFDMAAFLQSLGYKQMVPQPSGMDLIWLPPNHPLLKAQAGPRRLLGLPQMVAAQLA